MYFEGLTTADIVKIVIVTKNLFTEYSCVKAMLQLVRNRILPFEYI
jgi:hypothetical protein